MTSRLQNLVSADIEGNWDNHVQAVRGSLHIFIETAFYAVHQGALKGFDNYI